MSDSTTDENEETENDLSVGLSFIIVQDFNPIDADAVIQSGKDYGLELSLRADDDQEDDDSEQHEILGLELATGEMIFVMPVNAPHPDVSEMAVGPLSAEDNETLANAPAHIIVTVTGLSGTVDEIDIKMCAITASVLAGCKPLGVLKMPGVLFHSPDVFAKSAKHAAEDNELPMLVCVDITGAQETETHMSFLTHNMQRYGREEIYIVAPSEGEGAFNYMLELVAWMLSDREYKFPTGDTLGRTAEEQILIERVPNPTGEGPEVIRLQMP